jgi:ceramide glucosyltransferase
MITLLLFLGLVGLLTSSVFEGMTFYAALRYLFRRRRRSRQHLEFTAPISILKPLHGAFPDLDHYLEGYFHLDYPRYEILFCARHANDAGLAIARKVAERHPEIPVRILTSGEPPWLNARCYSLSLMVEAAQHDIMVMTDPDIPVKADYLRSLVAPFSDEKIGVITCLYRGKAVAGGIGERLEGLGMSVEMTSGVLVADMMEGIRFTLGPSTAVRRRTLEGIGGFEVLQSYAADDYMLGHLAAENGEGVILSDYVIDHCIMKCGFWKCLEHQLSWMRSTRFSRPKGHLGTGLTFAVPFGVLVFALGCYLGHPWLGAAALAGTVVTRMLQSILVGGFVVRDRQAISLCFLYAVRDLMGFCLWLASYFSANLRWHGRIFRLLPGGIMQRYEVREPEPAAPVETVSPTRQ